MQIVSANPHAYPNYIHLEVVETFNRHCTACAHSTDRELF